MRWREQLKSKTCFLKKVICFKYEEFQKNVNTRRRQQRASETDEKKQRLKKRYEKDRERRAQRLLQKKTSQDEDGEVKIGCSEVNQKSCKIEWKNNYSYLSIKSFTCPKCTILV